MGRDLAHSVSKYVSEMPILARVDRAKESELSFEKSRFAAQENGRCRVSGEYAATALRALLVYKPLPADIVLARVLGAN